MRGRLALAAVLGTAAALTGTGCGDDERPAARPLGKTLGGSVAPLVQCSDWTGGTRARQLATIADIRNQVNRGDTGIKAPPLSDAEATKLFDRACAAPYASGFRLYVIYARAAGFAPLLRESEK